MNAAVTGYEAISVDDVVLHAEVVAPMPNKLV